MIPKVILSLFDESGAWTAPFADAGHNVIQIDVKLDPDLCDIRKFCVGYLIDTLGIEWVDAIIAAPPCTDFTKSGAQYWARKDQDGTTAASAHLARQVLRCVEFWKPDWWVLENPVGRLPAVVPELGRPVMHFDPCDYAGCLDLTPAEACALDELRTKPYDRISAADIALVKRANAYTKKTALWGSFVQPVRKRIEPVRVCAQGSWLQKLGGKSEKTKQARSETPAGFARAFYQANEWTTEREAFFEARREAEEASA